MKKRLTQVLGFLLSSLGWLFVCCTLAMDRWWESQIGGMGGSNVIKVGWFWSNLWKTCFIDATAVSNCKDHGVVSPVAPYIQGVRSLVLGGMVLGFCGAILAFVGMECTYIGGSQRTNDRVLFAAAVFHGLGGLSSTIGYCVYTNRTAATAIDPILDPTAVRYGIGPPVLLGLVGSLFIILGSIFYAVTVVRSLLTNSEAYASRTYISPGSRTRTLYTGYYKPSRPSQYRQSRVSSNSRVSKISQISTVSGIEDEKMSERDAFV